MFLSLSPLYSHHHHQASRFLSWMAGSLDLSLTLFPSPSLFFSLSLASFFNRRVVLSKSKEKIEEDTTKEATKKKLKTKTTKKFRLEKNWSWLIEENVNFIIKIKHLTFSTVIKSLNFICQYKNVGDGFNIIVGVEKKSKKNVFVLLLKWKWLVWNL
jgi:hypothetical protein